MNLLILVSGLAAQNAPAFTILYHFPGPATSGRDPNSTLVEGSDGNFYGMTSEGGDGNSGTIFKITPAGAATELHRFSPLVNKANADGAVPLAALIQARDGNFYGTTPQGGRHTGGTVFTITPAGEFKALHHFEDYRNGGPRSTLWGIKGPLVEGSDGNFYGVTVGGGEFGDGTVYRLTPSGTLTVLFAFGARPIDGETPDAGLLLGRDGRFYGTTASGGKDFQGTIFSLSLTGQLGHLHRFEGSDGAKPSVPLTQGRAGDFYGSTPKGGLHDRGTIFKLTADGTLTVLHHLENPRYEGQFAGLLEAADGNLYGTGCLDGAHGIGSVFRVSPDGVFSVIHSFGPPADGTYRRDGFNPCGALIQGHDGKLYGVAEGGGESDAGVVFTITLSPAQAR